MVVTLLLDKFNIQKKDCYIETILD